MQRRPGHPEAAGPEAGPDQPELVRLREGAALHSLIAKGGRDLVCFLTLGGVRVYNSPSYAELLGDPEALFGTAFLDDVHRDDRARVRSLIDAVPRSVDVQAIEYRLKARDGSLHAMVCNARAVRGADGTLSGLILLERDVSEERAAAARLEFAVRRQDALVRFTLFALRQKEQQALLAQATAVVAEALAADLVDVLALEAGGEALRLVANRGEPSHRIGHRIPLAASQSARALALYRAARESTNEARPPVGIPDMAADPELAGSYRVRALRMRGSLCVVVPGPGEAYGTLVASWRAVHRDESDEAGFLQGIANVLAAALDRMQGEAALRESETQFRTLTDLSADWYWELDAELRFSYLSASYYAASKEQPEDIIGKRRWELQGAAPLVDSWDAHRRTLAARLPFRDFEYRRSWPEGELICVSVSGEPMFDAEGRFAGYRGTSRNVTAQHQLRSKLAVRARMGRALAEMSLRAMQGAAVETLLEHATVQAAEATGASIGSLFELQPGGAELRLVASHGRPVSQRGKRISAGDDTVAGVALKRYAATGGLVGFEFSRGVRIGDASELIPYQGSRGLQELGAVAGMSVIVPGPEQPFGVLEVFARESAMFGEQEEEFLTAVANLLAAALERSRILDALREGEARFRSLTKLSSDWYWEQDEQYRFSHVSEDYFAKSGVARHEVLGRCRWEVDGAAPVEGSWDEHRRQIEVHLPFRNFEYFRRRDDGTRVYHSVSGEPVFDAVGRFTGYRGTARDVTAQRRDQQELRERARGDATLIELGLVAAREEDLGRLFERALDAVAGTLDVELTKVLECLPDGRGLRLAAGIGWAPGAVGNAIVGAGSDSQAGYTLREYARSRVEGAEDFVTVIVDDLASERRFSGPPLLHEHGVVSGMSVAIPGHGGAWGVLGAHTRRRRRFARHEADFLQAAANLVGTAIERCCASAALRASEARFRSLTELSSDWYWEEDAELRFASYSSHAELRSGFPMAPLLGLRRWEVEGVTPLSWSWEEHRARLAARLPFRGFEFMRLAEDGAPRYFSVSGEPVFDDSGNFAGYRGVSHNITERKLAEQALRDLADSLRALSRRLVTVEEDQRRVLARELHDRVGQNLTAISINLEILRSSGAMAEDCERRLRESAELTELTAKIIDDVTVELRPPMLDEYGLPAALRWYAEQQGARTGLEIEVRAPEDGVLQPQPERDLALFRIVQEAINNVLRHAQAQRVEIDLRSSAQRLELSVRDDGRGLPPEADMHSRTRHGRRGMRERAAAIGGDCEVVPAAGGGTLVRARVP